ncbi:hypothetical protein Tco_0820586 [Tanacetum coccineum]|uniref:Uncharacterized protein n=1 Tax=Tanacetum coccineum TaxID=301880 RepID=A0ABQ5ACF7_9ASTR
MECKVGTLMKNAISLMGRSEGVFRMASNKMYQLPPEPSRQEEFGHIITNFILDREDRVKQLKEYMEVIMGDFMQLSSEVTKREIPNFDELEPQLLRNFSPLDVNIGDKRGTDPPIKPHSPDSFRMKEVWIMKISQEYGQNRTRDRIKFTRAGIMLSRSKLALELRPVRPLIDKTQKV